MPARDGLDVLVGPSSVAVDVTLRKYEKVPFGYVFNSSFDEIKLVNFALSIVVLSCCTLLCFIRNKFIRNLAWEIEKS